MQPYLFDPELDDTEGAAVAPATRTGLTLADARHYQPLWRDAVLRQWATKPRCLGVAATGTGKTFGAALIIREVLDGCLAGVLPSHQPDVLFLAHRGGLVEQSAEAFAALLPDVSVGVEMGDQRSRTQSRVVCGCIDSVAQPWRLRRLGSNRFAAVIWDEAHRYRSDAVRVERIMSHYAGSRHLGITATPDPGFNITDTFGDVVFNYDIGTAVADGFLVPPFIAYEVQGRIRLDGVRLNRDGEFDGEALGRRMSEAAPVAALVKAAVKWSNYSNGHPTRRPTIVGCASVDHADLVACLLNESHAKSGSGAAAAIHSRMPADRARDAKRDFGAGRLQYLCHFDMLTEGYDSDLPKLYVNGRPCRSRWVFAQATGRILRPDRSIRDALNAEPDAGRRRALIAASPKPGALVVDVAGTDHKLSVDLLEVLSKPTDSAETLRLARVAMRRCGEDGKPADPAAILERVRAAQVVREAELAAKWTGVTVDAELVTRVTDPFSPTDEPGRAPPWKVKTRPTERMVTALTKAGIPRDVVLKYSKGQAKRAMKVVVARRANGLCTYRQLETLRKYGVDGMRMTFDQARAEIDRIAANGWRA